MDEPKTRVGTTTKPKVGRATTHEDQELNAWNSLALGIHVKANQRTPGKRARNGSSCSARSNTVRINTSHTPEHCAHHLRSKKLRSQQFHRATITTEGKGKEATDRTSNSHNNSSSTIFCSRCSLRPKTKRGLSDRPITTWTSSVLFEPRWSSMDANCEFFQHKITIMLRGDMGYTTPTTSAETPPDMQFLRQTLIFGKLVG